MATSSKARYLAHGAFYAELRRRVEIHFATIGCAPNKAPGMYAKTAVMLGWFAASYVLLVFWAATYWQACALAVSLGLATAGIGFNVQHDGVHGGYSPRKGVNRLMALSLDMLGGSSYVWSWKHNVFHHSNPNAVGLDAGHRHPAPLQARPGAAAARRTPVSALVHLVAVFLASREMALRRRFQRISRRQDRGATLSATARPKSLEHGGGEVPLPPLGLWRSRAAPPDLAGGHVLRAELGDREPHDGRDISASPLRGGSGVSRPRRGGGAGAY